MYPGNKSCRPRSTRGLRLQRHGPDGQPRQALDSSRPGDPQLECYEAAVQFARTEGFLPAPETSHAIAQAIREANRAREEGKERVILFNWSGHGLMDMMGYEAFFDGKLKNFALPQEQMERSLACLEGLPKPPAL